MKKDFFTDEKYEEFIEEFENNWLQYASSDEKMKAYFGSENNAIVLFEKWKQDGEIWKTKKDILWSLDKKYSKN